jgi:DNA-binding transcriptional regulator YiaG
MTDFLPTQIITGEQIRAARAMLRLDQKQFASLTHLTTGAVHHLERTQAKKTRQDSA